MGFKEIGQLDPIGVLNNSALFEIEQGGDSFKASLAEIVSFLSAPLLSNVIIDTNKDWLGFDITNLGNLGVTGFLDLAEIPTPANPAADTGRLYVKDVTGTTALFFRDSAGVEVNLSDSVEFPVWTQNHDANGNALLNSKFADFADSTKAILLDLTGMTTAITLSLISNQSTTQSLTFPNITGSDVLVTENFSQTLASKTLTTPTIADFINATHDHENASGGGQLDSTLALLDTATIAYLNTPNVYTAGTRQDFLGDTAGTSGLNVGGIAGNPTTLVDGDIWLNNSTNQLFARVNGVSLDIGSTGIAPPFVDTTSIVEGSADATKQLRFEVDGFTTATTRVITPPDADIELIGLNIANTYTPSVGAIQLFQSGEFKIAAPGGAAGRYQFDMPFSGINRNFTFPDTTGTVLLNVDIQTITNKSISLSTNTITGTFAEFNTAVTDATLVDLDDVQTLTNKTINSTSNTITITKSDISDFPIVTADITDNNVTFPKLVDISTQTFIGRTTAASGDPEELTATQATAILNVFTDTLKGLVPLSGGGTTNFLRADGTFASPSGAGEQNTISSDGGGLGLTATISKVGVDLRVRSLAATSPLNVAEATNLITFTIDPLVNADISATAAIVNSKLADIATATILGRTTAGSGVREELTGTQATTLLDNFTDALKGLVPASGGGTANFLRADGTFAVPPGTGATIDGHVIQDEGTPLTQRANLNFVGAAVTVTDGGVGPDSTIVTITGGGDMILAAVQTVTGAKTFADNALLVQNPAETFEYLIQGGAIIADRTANLPVLTGNDTFVFEAHAATLTNKTIALGSNTVSGTFAQFNTAVTDATLVDLDDAQTLTNKVINAANNTITNIGSSEVVQDIITGHAAIAAVAVDDELLISDTSAVGLRRVDVSDLIQPIWTTCYEDDGPLNNEHYAVVGIGPGDADEIERQQPVTEACLTQKMGLSVGTNAEGSTTDWTIRINGANGNQTISVPATTTGFFRDVTNTDTLAVGDLINYQITNLGVAGFNIHGASMVATAFS